MSWLLDLVAAREAVQLREIDLEFFAAGGVSPFALLGYGAAPMMTDVVETYLDLGFTVTRERVRFPTRRRFVRKADCRGEPDDLVSAYLLPAIEGGFVVDTVAWHPRTGRLATEHGRAALLGADALSGVMSDGPVEVARDPREWLAGWRQGVCVVDERLARPALLEAARELQAADLAHGQRLKAMLEQVRLPKISVPASSVRSIAA